MAAQLEQAREEEGRTPSPWYAERPPEVRQAWLTIERMLNEVLAVVVARGAAEGPDGPVHRHYGLWPPSQDRGEVA